MVDKLSSKYKKMSFNVNLMYLSRWIEDNKMLKDIFKNVSKNVNILSFVDSYGALMPDQIKKFLIKVKNQNSDEIKIGTHFHNNCGLALANSLVAYNSGSNVIDTTFTGMGRGAGNAETELLLANLSSENKKISGFELSNLLEIFYDMKKKLNWEALLLMLSQQ